MQEQYTIYLRRAVTNNGGAHYGWQWSHQPPPNAVWHGDYKTESQARAMAKRNIRMPDGMKSSKRVLATFTVIVISALSAM